MLPLVATLVVLSVVFVASLWRLTHPNLHISAGDNRLHRVSADVFVYRGYFANSVVLLMPTGVVVVDTQVSPLGGQRLRDEIAKVTSLPIVRVINTHYHGDHTGGNAAFAGIETISTEDSCRYCVERDGERVHYATTFGLAFQHVHETKLPTRTFRGRLELEVGGDTLVVAQIGASETPDCCVVWWPSRGVVACGDGVATIDYPFLGVPFMDEGLRGDGQWIGFLRTLRDWKPRILVPGHGPALVGEGAIASRLSLLIELFGALISSTKRALQEKLKHQAIVDRVDRELARYREHPELAAMVVSQRFAIYRCINNLSPGRAGQGWWGDLRPSVIARAPRDGEIRYVSPQSTLDDVITRARDLVSRKRRDAAITLLELWVEMHPTSARGLAELADVLFDGAPGVRPKVDATEFFVEATRVAKQALAIDPNEPLAMLTLGMSEVFGGMVLTQPMDAAIARIERALREPTLTPKQRRKGQFFVAKAHQFELRDDASDAAFRAMLPAWIAWAFPLLRARLRAMP